MRHSTLANKYVVPRPANRWTVFGLAFLFSLLAARSPVHGFTVGHRVAAEEALSVVSTELQDLWQQQIYYAYDASPAQRPVAYWLTERFTYIPDLIDGAGSPESLPERQYLADYIYAERAGQQAQAWAYSDPDKPAWRPRTFHYMHFTKDKNRDFATRAANWYFHKMVDSFREDDALAASLYGGAFAHAVQDRTSPVHIWDGIDDAIERETFENQLAEFGLQEPDKSFRDDPDRWSLFWFLPDRNLEVDLEGYQPVILGDTVEEASRQFAFRLETARDDVRDILTEVGGFVSAHLKDNWSRRRTTAETDIFQQMALEEAAQLTADVWQTAFHLSQVPEPGGLSALLISALALILARRR